MQASFDWEAAIQDAPIGIAVVAPSGKWLELSPALARLVGYTREELLARSYHSITHPGDLEIEQSYLRAMQGGELDQYCLEKRCVHKDGRIVWVELHVAALRSGDAAPGAFIAQLVNIDPRHQRACRTQKLEAAGELARSVAHDFNNVITAIGLQVDCALAQPGLPERARESIRDITSAVDLGAKLARQLLRFCREPRPYAQPVNINASIRDLCELLDYVLPRTIHIDLQLSSARMFASADPSMIDQLVMNLVVNARDAMPDGGTVTIATGQVELDAAHARAMQVEPGRYVVLRCTDTGCGIAAANLPWIFEPFFTTKDPDLGRGLGLSTVLQIIKRHRGAIKVTSSTGDGTTFEVLLPVVEPMVEPIATSSRVNTAPAHSGDETILLVESDPRLRRTVGELLCRYGYRVLEAGDPAEALNVWDSAPRAPDLLLADLRTSSGVGGRELASELQARAPALKVLLTSGLSGDFTSVAELSIGQYFLAKPCPPSLLLETVRWCLDCRF